MMYQERMSRQPALGRFDGVPLSAPVLAPWLATVCSSSATTLCISSASFPSRVTWQQRQIAVTSMVTLTSAKHSSSSRTRAKVDQEEWCSLLSTRMNRTGQSMPQANVQQQVAPDFNIAQHEHSRSKHSTAQHSTARLGQHVT